MILLEREEDLEQEANLEWTAQMFVGAEKMMFSPFRLTYIRYQEASLFKGLLPPALVSAIDVLFYLLLSILLVLLSYLQ